MSKQNLEKTLRKELQVLNDVIDREILRGLSYAAEARRHKYIISTLSNVKRSQAGSWFTKSFSVI